VKLRLVRRSGGSAPAWTVPLVVGVACVLLAFGADGLREWGRYERAGLAAGELWRLISGHLVHLSPAHTVMNLVALGILVLLFEDCLRPREWSVVMLAAALTIDAGLYWLAASVDWYVGLSGVLHGVMLAGALKLLARRAGVAYLLLAAVLAKLAWEQLVGPVPGSESTAGGRVIVAAHLYGAIGGALGLLLLSGIRRLGPTRL